RRLGSRHRPALDRSPCRLQVWRFSSKPPQARISTAHQPSERLVDLVGNRGGQLAQSRDAGDARELGARLLQLRPRPPALGQIEHEGDTLAPALFEGCRADQYGNAAAVFPEIFLLERTQAPGHLELRHPPLYVAVVLGQSGRDKAAVRWYRRFR